MIFIVEVEHSSDLQRDGVWTELERHATFANAARAARWFRRPKGYAGRRVRVRESDADLPAPIAPPIPDKRWEARFRRAQRTMRCSRPKPEAAAPA